MRYGVLIPLLLAMIAVLAPTGLQAKAGPAEASPKLAGATADRAGTAVAQRGRRRPGCRRFCQQAGGFGGDETPNQPVHFPDQEIGGTRDQIVKVKATCTLDTECVGAILLGSTGKIYEYGRADLRIPAQTAAKVPVWISGKGLDSLKKHGDDKKAFATVPLVDETQPVSIGTGITLLAP